MADEQGTVGLIGLGQMGGAMCRTLLRRGWRVVAWDVARAALDAAAEAGAEAASDPAGVASRAEIVITSVPDVEAVREAALGDRGIVRGDCAGRLLIDTSTVLPAGARALAADLSHHGVGFLDAPVSGGVRGADSGQLAIMVGGSVEHLERAGPVLACLGKAVVHCGPVGAGQIARSCNQLVVMATHGLAREAGLNLPVFSAAARQFERLVDAVGGAFDNSAVITVIEPHRWSAPTAGG